MPPLLSPRAARTPNQPLTTNPKTPSPNYFGFTSNEDSFLPDSSTYANKTNFSPPSSAIRSTAAASPSVVPLDQNPDFDAFRKQSEGKAFNLGGIGGSFGTNLSMPAPSNSSMSSAMRPSAGHRRTSSNKKASEQMREAAQTAHRKSLDPSTAELGRSPKRVLSPGSIILPEEVRRASPASFAHSEPTERSDKDATGDTQPRFALPLDDKAPAYAAGIPKMHKAETLPGSTAGGEDAPIMVTAQHVVNLLESRMEQVLVLDLRVQTQYAASHISGALSLCIPTTLLKRPSFNVQKLAEAFKDEDQRKKFERWRSCSYIIVYDGASSLLKDATVCLNTIKKFKSEGYEGTLYIVKGGFAEFSRRFPSYVDDATDSDTSDSSRAGDAPDAIPVMGGCPMPSTDKPANPFFGNIRQNMDLIGGVGQIPLEIPAKATQSTAQDFPSWLRYASSPNDKGARVAQKFEQIERREKKRMEDALSTKVHYNSGSTPKKQSAPNTPIIRLAGLEKGSKNRYNNIWPFEHTRVKIQSVPNMGCDYVNASYIQAAGCAKRYISTQAPIPATFNDFWNIVWQQDVRVIVMLTAEKEGAQVKAHNYWSGRQFGPLRVDFVSEKRASIEPDRIRRHRAARPAMGGKRMSTGPALASSTDSSPSGPKQDEPYVVVRRFTVTHEKFPFAPIREVTQLQYAQWPDFGAPAHPAHLLGLVEQCENVVRSSSSSFSSSSGNGPIGEDAVKRPILVHCSAGCGRTGTFCTVDSVIDMLKRQRKQHPHSTGPTSSRSDRGGTPMDIDTPSPDMARSQPPKTPKKVDDGGDFFSSSFSTAEKKSSQDDAAEDEDVDLVEKTVEDFRHQRISMVQSLRQYVLCYESVMEWLALESRGK
jgi:tyrosine-protein phosphatase 2/3